MRPHSDISNQSARKRQVLLYELYSMILEFLSLEELISRAKAVNEAWEKTLGNVSKSIFLTSKAPPTAESEDQRLGKVKESVFKKVAKKAGEDTLNQALADSLSARVSGRRLKEAYLQDLSGCPLIVAQLRELCLIPYGDIFAGSRRSED